MVVTIRHKPTIKMLRSQLSKVAETGGGNDGEGGDGEGEGGGVSLDKIERVGGDDFKNVAENASSVDSLRSKTS